MFIDFNIKEKIKELKKQEKTIPREYFDIGIAFWLLNPDEKEYKPEVLSRKYLQKEFLGKRDIKSLYDFARKKLKDYKLEKIFYEIEIPLVEVLADMELRGIKIKSDRLKKLGVELTKELTRISKLIYKKTKGVFNINSPKQLSEILFYRLKVDSSGIKKTKSGLISTDNDALLLIKDKHPAVRHILSYREIFKLKSTYVDPFQELIDKNGRVHTSYIQTGTATGRLSSQNPNLQNIPVTEEASNGFTRDNWAKELRKTFVAENGYKLASFDYSQIELRILASLSSDPKMIEAFNQGQDIHKITAANIFNISLEKVTSQMRRLAKTLNFGIVYGMGSSAFAKASGLDAASAKKFIQEYFSDFKKIKDWQEEIKAQARTYGYVSNLNGRRRWLLKAVSMFRGEAAEAERAAINMPVQGLAADIIKMAMIKIKNIFKAKNWWDSRIRLLLTIHDELLFEIETSIIKEAIKTISSLMTSVYELEVPIEVNVKAGDNWGEMKK